jgi:hypothetical protein
VCGSPFSAGKAKGHGLILNRAASGADLVLDGDGDVAVIATLDVALRKALREVGE